MRGTSNSPLEKLNVSQKSFGGHRGSFSVVPEGDQCK